MYSQNKYVLYSLVRLSNLVLYWPNSALCSPVKGVWIGHSDVMWSLEHPHCFLPLLVWYFVGGKLVNVFSISL